MFSVGTASLMTENQDIDSPSLADWKLSRINSSLQDIATALFLIRKTLEEQALDTRTLRANLCMECEAELNATPDPDEPGVRLSG